MKLYFMKQEAMDLLKGNLDAVYNMYFTENDNKWLWKVCDGDPFVEFKDIREFHLAPVDADLSKGQVEFENCKIIYKHLSFLTESQASDERIWAGLCHSIYYDYLRKRWGYDKQTPKTPKEAVSNIKSRFFFSGGTRAGLFRNSLAKCWWVGRNTYDSSNVNPFEKLDVIGSNDISTKISDIFYSNNFSANPIILNGIVKGMKQFKKEGIQLSLREHIRPTLQFLNAVGGSVVLDCLTEDEIADIFVNNIYGILQGDGRRIEYDIQHDEYENLNHDEYEVLDKIDDVCITLGQRVIVRVKETDEQKIIAANYISNSMTIPPLVELLLGRRVGEQVKFKNQTYVVEEIQRWDSVD